MLTLTQLQTVKTAVLADSTAAAARTAGDSFALLAWLNGPSATNLWNSRAPVNAVLDAISFATYTANDAIGVADTTLTYLNRQSLAWVKLTIVQVMTQGRDVLNAVKANIRQGLRDAVIALPTGTSGAMQSAGGSNGATVLAACIRLATNTEAALVGASATTGTTTAFLPVFEGLCNAEDAAWLINN